MTGLSMTDEQSENRHHSASEAGGRRALVGTERRGDRSVPWRRPVHAILPPRRKRHISRLGLEASQSPPEPAGPTPAGSNLKGRETPTGPRPLDQPFDCASFTMAITSVTAAIVTMMVSKLVNHITSFGRRCSADLKGCAGRTGSSIHGDEISAAATVNGRI